MAILDEKLNILQRC